MLIGHSRPESDIHMKFSKADVQAVMIEISEKRNISRLFDSIFWRGKTKEVIIRYNNAKQRRPQCCRFRMRYMF